MSEIIFSQPVMNLKIQVIQISKITFQTFCDPFTIKCSFTIAKFVQIIYFFNSYGIQIQGIITFEYCSQKVLYILAIT